MRKIRIAVFGINDGIVGALQEKINSEKAEIVLFLDNDETKEGICYRDIPIAAPSREICDEYAVEAYLVAALSSYGAVKRQLMELGITEEMIHIFWAEDICKYCLGSFGKIDRNFIRKIYFEPERTLELVRAYKEIYERYSKIPVYEDETNAWFSKTSLISHACGGVVDHRRMMYTNSKEAFQYSMDKGFKLLECDVLLVGDNELMLGHDYKCFYESSWEHYTMMTVKEFLQRVKQHKEVHCLIDVKWKKHDEYRIAVNRIEEAVFAVSADENESVALKKQIVMEVYDETTIQIAKENNYEMIFTQYKNPDWQCFMNTAVLCYKYNIRAVALAVSSCFLMEKFMKIITDKGIKVFAFSTDSINAYSALKKMRVTGIFTNYLTESAALEHESAAK